MSIQKKSGFTLIEVLISLILLSVMLSALITIELKSIQITHTAEKITLTAQQQENASEQLHALEQTNRIHPD